MTRRVLAAWQLALRSRSGSISGAEWHKITVSQQRSFDKGGLPDKIKDLQKAYSLALDPDLAGHLLSINRARNCLVHRGGIVQDDDLNEDGVLRVSWRRLALVIRGPGSERDGFPGARFEADESLVVANRDVSKGFPLGTAISFSVQEFADVCWSLFLLALSTVKLAEDWTREHGITLQMSQDGLPGATSGKFTVRDVAAIIT